jgi:hypothetical protein
MQRPRTIARFLACCLHSSRRGHQHRESKMATDGQSKEPQQNEVSLAETKEGGDLKGSKIEKDGLLVGTSSQSSTVRASSPSTVVPAQPVAMGLSTKVEDDAKPSGGPPEENTAASEIEKDLVTPSISGAPPNEHRVAENAALGAKEAEKLQVPLSHHHKDSQTKATNLLH